MNLKKKIYLLAVLFAFACGGNEEMQEEKNPEEESAGELTEEVFFEYDLAEDGAEESTEINKANKPRIQKPYYMRIHDGNFLSKTGYDKFEHTTAEDLTYSLDYWEDNAARVIQKNFLICRYNPKYAFCRKILNRQFDEYTNGISD